MGQDGREALEDALAVLRREAAAAPSRELSLAVTNAEQALMWREKVDIHEQPQEGAQPQGAPEQHAPPQASEAAAESAAREQPA